MSPPCSTLAEAIHRIELPQTETVDVLAVVVKYCLLQSPSAAPSVEASSMSFPRVDLYISDSSIVVQNSIKVSLYGTAAVASAVKQNIKTGDVIRFNALTIAFSSTSRGANGIANPAVGGGGGTTNTNANTNTNTTAAGGTVTPTANGKLGLHGTASSPAAPTLAAPGSPVATARDPQRLTTFRHSNLHPPHDGLSWLRLGRIDRFGRYQQTCDLDRIPKSMTTPSHLLNQLISWYGEHTLNPNQNGDLSSVDCRRRLLDEVQHLSGLHSTIIVRVKSYDIHSNGHSMQSKAGMKRRRGNTVGATSSMTGFATLTDKTGVVMMLIDPGGRFERLLDPSKRQISGQNFVVKLTNVVTQHGRNVQADLHLPPDEIVLIPTSKTSVIDMSENDLPDAPSSTQQQQSQTQATAKGVGSNVGIPNSNNNNNEHERQQQSQTISRDTGQSQQGQPASTSSYIMINAYIEDIHVNGTSIKDATTASDFCALVLNSTNDAYRNLIVTLGLRNSQSATTALTQQALSKSNMTRCLFGGVDAKELADVGEVICGMVQGYLKERTMLCWTVHRQARQQEQQDAMDNITVVTLPSL